MPILAVVLELILPVTASPSQNPWQNQEGQEASAGDEPEKEEKGQEDSGEDSDDPGETEMEMSTQ